MNFCEHIENVSTPNSVAITAVSFFIAIALILFEPYSDLLAMVEIGFALSDG